TPMVKKAMKENPNFAEVIKRHGTLSINEVVNAFIHVIENDYLYADVVKVTQTNLLEVLPKMK
ncbi:11587_t:CDS:1, partial [Dentiscutata erythropus]